MLWASLTALLLIAPAGFFVWRTIRRRRALAAPFPAEWDRWLSQYVPLEAALDGESRRRLRRHVQAFLYDKRFFGCAGQEISDAVRVAVAGNACLLLAHREGPVFPRLRFVLVYAAGFIVEHEEEDEAGVVTHHRSERLGESWEDGKMIVSWEDVVYDADNPHDGENLVVHEAAHQLDAEDGAMNGTPRLPPGLVARWREVMSAEYDALCAAVDAGRDTWIDPYAATDPSEFFAVVSEHFVEQRAELANRHPRLFELLSAVYV